MGRFINGLFIAAGAVVLAVGVLVCAERLLSNRPKRARRDRLALDETLAVAAAEEETVDAVQEATPARRNFSIRRTKSEVGFVYWILQGYGRYKCYVLCDSWDEAVAQAKARLAEIDGADVNSTAAAVASA